MNKLITALLVLIAGTAQAQNFVWAKGFFGDPFPGVTSIATDASDNVYVTGSFSTTTDVDPGAGVVNIVPNFNTTEAYIVKLDASGSFLWVRILTANTSTDVVISRDIAVDDTGSIYIAGSFNGTIDFNPGAPTANLTSMQSDGFVVKLDSSGNFMYANPMGGTGSDLASALCRDNQGNVMVTGMFELMADFDPTINSYNLVSLGMQDVFVVRYNAQGNFVWAKSRGSMSDNEITQTIITDAAGGIFGTTSTNDTLTIFRLDGAGTFTWVKQLWPTTPGTMNIRRLALDPNGGDIYATGSFSGAMDFDPGANSTVLTANSSDLFLLKLYNSGNFGWARMIDATGIATNATVGVYDMNNVYVAASYSGVADLDPGVGVHNVTAVSGAPDIFIAKFNTLGNFVSGFGGTMGGQIDDALTDMAINTSGDIHLTGAFRDTADFDPGNGVSQMVASGSGYSVFIVKLSSTLSVNGLSGAPAGVYIYPNPSSGTLVVETGNSSYSTYTIYNSIGHRVASKTMNTNMVNIEVSTLPSGVYYMVLDGKDGMVTGKFTKL